MKIKYLEDTSAYLNDECKQRILFELYSNSLRTIKSVYIFNNFNEYVIQCNSDKNEEKSNVYWNSNYFEKMIDLVKISLAFETFNKAVLLEEGYLIHKLQKNSFNKLLFTVQEKGFPIKTMDFMEVCDETSITERGYTFLTGFRRNFPTIKYSLTLTERYQKIIKLDQELCFHLKEINQMRNKLHFFTDFKGGYQVAHHIKKWNFIMKSSISTIENKCRVHFK